MKTMHNHITESVGSVIGLLGYCIYQIFNTLGFNLLQVNMMETGYDLANKFIGMGFGVTTALFSYFLIYLAKRYITKEEIKTRKNKK